MTDRERKRKAVVGDKIELDPDIVAGLGNEMLSISMRLRTAPSAVGKDALASLGKAGEGSQIAATYVHLTQTAPDAADALASAVETNGTYVLYAAQNADDAFN